MLQLRRHGALQAHPARAHPHRCAAPPRSRRVLRPPCAWQGEAANANGLQQLPSARAALAAAAAAALIIGGPPAAWAEGDAGAAADDAAPVAALASALADGGGDLGAGAPGLEAAPAPGEAAPEAAPAPGRLQEVAATVERDFVEGQYYITGKLTPDLYAPDAVFVDPTTRVQGVAKYTAAVAALFDPASSRADLISIEQLPGEGGGEGVVRLRWRLEGKLAFFGGVPFKPYTGTTRYVLGPDGRIVLHEETWDVSAADIFISLIFPSYGAPPAPPVSQDGGGAAAQ